MLTAMVTVKQYNPSRAEETIKKVFAELESSFRSGRVLWLCPNHRLIRVRTSQLAGYLRTQGRRAIEMPSFSTINDFAVECAKYSLHGKKLLNRIHQEMVVRNLVAQLEESHQAESAFLKGNFSSIEAYTKSVSSFIQEIKSHTDLSSEQLEKEVEKAIETLEKEDYVRLDSGRWERIKARALYPVKVFKAYEAYLTEKDFFDTEDAIKANIEKSAFQKDVIVIDSFLDLEPHELDFIRKLIKIADSTLILIPSFEIGYLHSDKDPYKTHIPEYLNLISADSFEKGSLSKRECLISIDACETRAEEVREIALRVKALVDSGCPPEQICIIFPEIEKYASMIGAALEGQGLKYNLSKGRELINRPRGRFFLQALDVCVFDFEANTFCNFLFNLELKVLDLYEKSLFIKNLTREEIYVGFETLLNVAEKIEPRETSQKLERLLALLKTLEERNSLSEIVMSLFEIAKYCGVLPENETYDAVGRREIDAISEALRSCSLAHSSDILSMDKESGYSDPKKLLVLAGSLFSAALSSESSVQIGDVAEGVQVTGYLESRGSSFRFLFLGGLVDEKFPGKPKRDIFLAESVRKKLGLPGSTDFFEARKREFWRLLSSAKEGVFCSWHRRNGSEEYIRSRFLDELELLLKVDAVMPSGIRFKELNWESFKKQDVERSFAVVEVKASFEPSVSQVEKPVYRVTDIIAYNDCPYKFKLVREFGVCEAEFPDPFLSGRTVGNVVHLMLAGFAKEHLSESERLLELSSALNENYELTIEFIEKELRKLYKDAILETFDSSRYGEKVIKMVSADLSPQIQKIISHLSKFIAERIPRVDAIEAEKEIRKDIGAAIIVGKIDWMEHIGERGKTDEKAVIIRDFKVAPISHLYPQRNDRLQVNIYKELVESKDNRSMECSVVYVNEAALKPLAADYKQGKSKFNLTEVVEKMVKGASEKKGNCEYCFLKKYCWHSLERVWT